MIRALKNWFIQLSQREQYIVASGAVIGALLIVYVGLWSPLVGHVASVRLQAYKLQQTVTWLLHAEKRVLAARQQQTHARRVVNNVMVTVEHSLAEQGLAQYLNSVKQPESNQVQINLRAVPFDTYVRWLQALLQQNKLHVVKIAVHKGALFGTTDVDFTVGN